MYDQPGTLPFVTGGLVGEVILVIAGGTQLQAEIVLRLSCPGSHCFCGIKGDDAITAGNGALQGSVGGAILVAVGTWCLPGSPRPGFVPGDTVFVPGTAQQIAANGSAGRVIRGSTDPQG